MSRIIHYSQRVLNDSITLHLSIIKTNKVEQNPKSKNGFGKMQKRFNITSTPTVNTKYSIFSIWLVQYYNSIINQ